MAFTENDLKEQEHAFVTLKEEFSRTTARLDGMLKESGLSGNDLKKALEESRSPELEKLFEQAKAEAAQAGRTRAAQVTSAETAEAGKTGRRPRGALVI